MAIEPAATPNPGSETEPNSLAAAAPAAALAEASAAAVSEPAKATAAPVAAPAAPPQAAAPVAPIRELTAGHRDEPAPIRGAPLMPAPSSRGRFPLLAASIAIAAALGSIAGGGAFTAASHLFAVAPPPAVKAEPNEDTKELQARVAQLRTSVKGLTDSVATLRTANETAGKGSAAQLARMNEQLAKLAEAVERSERAQAEPAARLSKAVEALERADRRVPAQPETTGSIPAPRAEPPKPAIVGGWLLRSVIDGVALLETQDRVIEVEVGDTIRGVGRVEDIRRQDGRWVVATSKGLIVTRR